MPLRISYITSGRLLSIEALAWTRQPSRPMIAPDSLMNPAGYRPTGRYLDEADRSPLTVLYQEGSNEAVMITSLNALR
jgi:hypothetical protein